MPALPERDKRMVYWEIKLFNKDKTLILSDIVGSFSIKYETNIETEATIQILSESYIEDWFVPGIDVEINMGYDRTKLVSMFYGEIRNYPVGEGSDFLRYVVKAYGKGSNMALAEKNKNWAGKTKSEIVKYICTNNGVTPDVSISDDLPLDPSYIPMQKNKTDFDFLRDCAAKWGCVMWFRTYKKKTTLYSPLPMIGIRIP